MQGVWGCKLDGLVHHYSCVPCSDCQLHRSLGARYIGLATLLLTSSQVNEDKGTETFLWSWFSGQPTATDKMAQRGRPGNIHLPVMWIRAASQLAWQFPVNDVGVASSVAAKENLTSVLLILRVRRR